MRRAALLGRSWSRRCCSEVSCPSRKRRLRRNRPHRLSPSRRRRSNLSRQWHRPQVIPSSIASSAKPPRRGRRGRIEESIGLYQKAVKLRPSWVGRVLASRNRVLRAGSICGSARRVRARRPAAAQACRRVRIQRTVRVPAEELRDGSLRSAAAPTSSASTGPKDLVPAVAYHTAITHDAAGAVRVRAQRRSRASRGRATTARA